MTASVDVTMTKSGGVIIVTVNKLTDEMRHSLVAWIFSANHSREIPEWTAKTNQRRALMTLSGAQARAEPLLMAALLGLAVAPGHIASLDWR